MADWKDFDAFTKRNEPLAPFTFLRLGGPAEYLIQPRTREELSAVVRHCSEHKIPIRVLGGGCNIVVREEGVRGAVLRLCEPAFTAVRVEGTVVHAGTGAPLAALISESTRQGLTGLEVLVGIPGTVGGAVRANAGDRTGEIGQFVQKVEVLDENGNSDVHDRDELQFSHRFSNLDDAVLVSAYFELDRDDPEAIVKRMRKAWILRKAQQPHSFEAYARMFKNPRGLDAAALIEQAGLVKTRVGGAEISDRFANSVVVHPGATAAHVVELLNLVESKVRERFSIDLERDMAVW